MKRILDMCLGRISFQRKESAKFTDQYRIMVVDDDPTFLHLMEAVGERVGAKCVSCDSLEKAKELLKQGSFDAAVIDYYLDDISHEKTGIELAQTIANIPVVLVSSTTRGLNEKGFWPASVQSMINKEDGPNKILETAIKLSSRFPG